MGKFYTIPAKSISKYFLLILFCTIASTAFSQGPGPAWQYNRKITLSTPTTMANYQVRVMLDTLIMGNPYTGVNSNLSDLRFYDVSNTPCPYWIEKEENTDTSIIWVKIPTSGSTEFTMYYGNSSATSLSDASSTFDWFEGFDGPTLNTSSWDTSLGGGGLVTVSGGNAILSKTTSSDDYAYLYPKAPGFSPASTSFYLESKFRASAFSRNRFYASDRSGNVTPGVAYCPLIFDYGYFTNQPEVPRGYAWYTYTPGSGYVDTVYPNKNYITQWAITDKSDYNWSTLSYPSYIIEDAQAASFNKDVRYITFGLNYGSKALSTYIDWVRVRKRQPFDPETSVGALSKVAITKLSSLTGCKGSILTINGNYLGGATDVRIGVTPVASIVSNDDEQIVVVIGNGTSGKITVTTPLGIATSTDDFTVTTGTVPDFFSVTGGGLNCNGASIGLSGSQTGITYELLRNGNPLSPAITLPGTGAPLDFGIYTTEGSYSVLATNGTGTCTTEMDNHAEVSIAPGIKITTGNPEVCLGDVISLTASLASEKGVSSAISRASGPVSIPDNNPKGEWSVLSINYVPANTIITNIEVRFKITHPDISDLIINLQGPNGKVINIANGMGSGLSNFGGPYGDNLVTTDNLSATNISLGNHPYTDKTYAPHAEGGVQGATLVTNNISNVISFMDLITGADGSAANGWWILSVRDTKSGNSGTLDRFEMKIDFAYTSNPLNVTWASSPDLYIDKNATIPYIAGTSTATVFAKPTSSGTATYQATSGSSGCVASKSIIVNAAPNLEVSADYCTPGSGTVRIKATADPSPSPSVENWVWNAGTPTNSAYDSYIDVTAPGLYYVGAKATGSGCTSKAEIEVANNLVINGDFEDGNVNFTSEYRHQYSILDSTTYKDVGYTVSQDAGWHSSGKFYGAFDHTYGLYRTGNFMIANIHAISGITNKEIWKSNSITVKPNTKYYFSFWAMSLKSDQPEIQIEIDGAGTYTGGLSGGTKVTLAAGENNNFNNGWQRFYSEWEAGPSTNSVTLKIINAQADFRAIGIDDIVFGTLTPFFSLKSDATTVDQKNICAGAPIKDIVFETGGNGDMPTISGTLPAGINAYWDGRNYRLSGYPTTPGNYSFDVEANNCGGTAFSSNVKIEVLAPPSAGTISGGPLISVCSGSSGTLSVTGTNGNVNWQVSDDGITWSPVADGGYSFLSENQYYRTIASIALPGCANDTSDVVRLTPKNLWAGKTNTNWNTASNWSDGNATLDPGCDVVIPELATARYPELNTENVSVGTIDIKPNAKVTVQGSALFDITGDLYSEGGMDVTDGAIKFSGTNEQHILGELFTDTTIKKLIVNNNDGLNIDRNPGEESLAITGKIEFASGAAKIYGNGNITLKSTKQHTANLGVVTNANQVNGDFIVERYINIGTGAGEHRKAWHIIAPNTNGQTIKESWMENGDNSVVGYGINLTGTSALGGWDDVSPAPAIKYYSPNSGQGTWIGAANSGVALNSQNAWMVFVRGDRSVTGQWDDPKPTTLRSKGELTTGNKTYNITPIAAPGGFYLVGNPYPSAVEVRKIASTEPGGKIDHFYIWNPNIGGPGTYGLGAYQTFVWDGADYITTDFGSTTANFIQSGQGFFVQTSPSGYDLTFSESAKVDGSDNTMFFRPNEKGKSKSSILRSGIMRNDVVEDGTIQMFSDEYLNEIDMADGRKMINTGINLSVKVANQLLVVERRQHLTPEDTIQYNLTGTANGKYTFVVQATDMDATGLEGWFEDAFTGQRQQINLEGVTNISFDVTAAAASKAANRFRIVFQAARGPMPVTFVKVDAVKDGNDVKVKWDVANEINLKKYVVMRSADGNNFSEVGKVRAEGKNAYSFNDQQPLNGYNYYRIKSVDLDGTEAYSPVAKVWMGEGAAKISVFPNPIVNGIVDLRLENMSAGKYHVRLLNPIGQVILTRDINHPGGNYSERIPWDYNMAHGTYQLEVNQPDGGKKIIRIMY